MFTIPELPVENLPARPAVSEQKVCPFCKELIQQSAIKCRHCRSVLVPMQNDQTSISTGGVTTPVLISAIGNILVALFYFGTCFLFFIGIPLVILCIFEFIFYGSRFDRAPEELASKARTLGIIEIVAGFFNLISLVCGIIVLVNAGSLERRARETMATR